MVIVPNKRQVQTVKVKTVDEGKNVYINSFAFQVKSLKVSMSR